MAENRNHTLELLKLFTAYMVVFLHVPFYGAFGVAVNALARYAVPFFFLVSGFFSYQITPEKIKGRIAHLAFLLGVAIVICTASNLSALMLRYGFRGLIYFFSQYLNFESLLNLLLFNKTIQVEYLWYLLAMLYVYALYYLAASRGMKDGAYWAIGLTTLGLNLILGELLSVFGVVVPNYLIRNFALTGIPFFCLGMLANKHQRILAGTPSPVILLSMVIGMAETLLARFSFGKSELHLGSVLMLFSFTAVFIKHPNVKLPGKLAALAGCGTYIYILHPIVSGAILSLLAMLGVHPGMKGHAALCMVHPLLVCIISTILAHALNRILTPLERKIKRGGAA